MPGHTFTDLAHMTECVVFVANMQLQKAPSQKEKHTHTDWGSHTPSPACSYSTVVTIKKLF